MSIFNMDSSFMRALGKIADLMILNVVTLLLCLPVVTGGAAITALHYMCLKLVRNEEGYILKGYFGSFRENFRQSTIMWLLFLLAAAVVAGDIVIMRYAVVEFPFMVRVGVLIMGLVVLCTALYAFPMQAKFANPIKITIRNAFMASLAQFPKTFLMLLLLFVGPLMILAWSRLAAVVFFFGLSVHAYLSAKLYNRFFERMEARDPEKAVMKSGEEEDVRIFHDRPEGEIEEEEEKSVREESRNKAKAPVWKAGEKTK